MAATPAPPALRLPEVFEALVLPCTEGSVATKASMLTGASALISSSPSTVTGVGASKPERARREPVTMTCSISSAP